MQRHFPLQGSDGNDSQVTFGFAADVLGRRKMYGLELVIVIVGTLLFIMSSNGEQNSMSVAGWMIAWRAVSHGISSKPSTHLLTATQRRLWAWESAQTTHSLP